MVYSIHVKVKPKSEALRTYLLQKDFKIYGQSYLGDFLPINEDDTNDSKKWSSYKCIRSGKLKPSQDLVQRLDEELMQGGILEYNILATK